MKAAVHIAAIVSCCNSRTGCFVYRAKNQVNIKNMIENTANLFPDFVFALNVPASETLICQYLSL
ncbi:MAG: hypothetical protein GXO86_08710 [Chlorobi bacterium]|nr:hypothetical protein [Chlorobiota bacterium]